MLGGLLGQLQGNFQSRPNWMASYNPMWQSLGNMQPSTANSMNLMKWTNDPSAQGSNKLTPNYTGLFGMMGQQPQMNQTRTMAQNDYLNRVMAKPQQAPQPLNMNALQQQLASLGLLVKSGNGYITPDQAHWEWQSTRDGG